MRDVLDSLNGPALGVLDLAEGSFDSSGRSIISDGVRAYYHDHNHLNPFGVEELLGAPIRRVLTEMRQSNRQERSGIAPSR